MARTITEIYNQMLTAKDAEPALAGLTSTSLTAVWRLLFYVVAVCMWSVENLFDQHKAEVTTILNNLMYGTLPWFRTKALEYQHGDILQYVNGHYAYVAVDTSKQIVKYAAAIETGSVVHIKVSKEEKLPLSVAELEAFQYYIRNYVRPAGVRVQVTSYNPDILRCKYTIYYDPVAVLATVKSNVATAIDNYLSSLPYNGLVHMQKLTDAIQSAEGVTDCILTELKAKTDLQADFSDFERVYNPLSGVMAIDEDNPIATYFNWTAYV